ncbi:hypothetical protein [uncultured Bacteroides sp.]|uniref:hypothetical protein n=1 Tax=uncultured Bacteroides sp. TaxID=162156 RepID=UPI00262F9689|nr:hypothetical protein [uncultured Bacteroides sp.]
MSNKSINSNKQFMIGNGILAFGVFFIVCLFLYLGFRGQKKGNGQTVYEGIYTIEIADNFAGDSISVYINDSLLLNRTMDNAGLKLQVNRFAEENALMIVDNKTDEITPFNLSPKGSLISVEKRNGRVFIQETEAKGQQ